MWELREITYTDIGVGAALTCKGKTLVRSELVSIKLMWAMDGLYHVPARGLPNQGVVRWPWGDMRDCAVHNVTHIIVGGGVYIMTTLGKSHMLMPLHGLPHMFITYIHEKRVQPIFFLNLFITFTFVTSIHGKQVQQIFFFLFVYSFHIFFG